MAPPSATNSPSSSSSNSSTTNPNANPNPNPNGGGGGGGAMQSWWESISRARASILSLSSLLSIPSLSSLADSDRPASSLLSSSSAASAISSALSSPSSGSGHDPLCHWLYDTLQSPDHDLQLIPLSFLPLISGLYLSRIVTSSPAPTSLAGFESVLLAVYAAETRSRNGKPLTLNIPDLSQPSLYHAPRTRSPRGGGGNSPAVGILSPPLEPQIAVKSTKRACIVGVALECYFKKISLMPARSKIDLCEFAVAWAGQNCPCRYELDDNEENPHCDGNTRGCRVPLPWELIQPVLRILGHCLLGPGNGEEVREAARAAVRSVYARGVHDLEAKVILAARSLIQLDKSARKAVVGGVSSSNPSTPSKTKKPEMLLVSK